MTKGNELLFYSAYHLYILIVLVDFCSLLSVFDNKMTTTYIKSRTASLPTRSAPRYLDNKRFSMSQNAYAYSER
jgi:hypothetical protein